MYTAGQESYWCGLRYLRLKIYVYSADTHTRLAGNTRFDIFSKERRLVYN